ncbi:MAG: V-type ATP synthase subunit D [Gammaproteobacteria bacterium]|nr:V-type ATP synthase subunit D [Gammaproteobacteria bacterium]
MPEYAVSRAALLEIRRERRMIQEGHRFLDEKRILIAQELLKRLAGYRELMQRWEQSRQQAREALKAALLRHGLEGLQVYPVQAQPPGYPPATQLPFLGILLLQETPLEQQSEQPPQHPDNVEACSPSPESRACARQHAGQLQLARTLALARANLLRLRDEYQRTERRVRAIENVILPEIAQQESAVADQLEELDQEEVIRAHLFASRLRPAAEL